MDIDDTNPRYAVIKKLRRMVQSGELPQSVNWVEVYRFWTKHHPSKKEVQSWVNKPRFYNRAQTCNYRARKQGASGTVTADDLEAVFAKYSGRCVRCKQHNHLVFDHITSYYRGGANTVDNLQLLCRLCNMEKGVN